MKLKLDISSWIIIICAVVLFGTGILMAYSTYGAPSEFGNETDTTCFIGGDDGIVNCTGNVTAAFYIGDGKYLINAGNLSWNESKAWILFAPNTTAGIQYLINNTNMLFTNLNVTGYYYGNGSQLTSLNHSLDNAYDVGENTIDVDTDDVIWDLTSTQDFIVQDNGREIFRIDNAGDIYVGQVEGDQILAIRGNTISPTYAFEDSAGTGMSWTGSSLKFSVNGDDVLYIRNRYTKNLVTLYFENDGDTGIFWPGADTLAFSAGSQEFLRFDEGGTDVTIFNEDSSDIDFRIESDNDENSFYMDGETGEIGLGTNDPSQTLDVRGIGNFSGTVYINNATDLSYSALTNIENTFTELQIFENITIETKIDTTLNSHSCFKFKTNGDVGVSLSC